MVRGAVVVESILFLTLTVTACQHGQTPLVENRLDDAQAKSPRLFRCAGLWGTGSHEIRGFIDPEANISYFQSWYYEGGGVYDRLKTLHLRVDPARRDQRHYRLVSKMGELSFTFPFDVPSMDAPAPKPAVGFSGKLTILRMPDRDPTQVSLTCTMWNSGAQLTPGYDMPPVPDPEVTL